MENKTPYITTTTNGQPVKVLIDDREQRILEILRRLRAQGKDAMILVKPDGTVFCYRGERAGRIDYS